jgi:hypothetical protein
MGFVNREGKVDHYLSVVGGKVAERVNENTPGAVKRVNKNEKVVYEMLHDGLDDMIFMGATIENSDYGEQIRIKMESDGETFQLSVPFQSRYGNSLLWKFPFVDVGMEFNIYPYDFEGDEGKVTGFSITQGGEKVKAAFTEGVVPQPVAKKGRGGKEEWDYTERENFLYDNFLNWAKNADPTAIPEPTELEDQVASDAGNFEEASLKDKVVAKSKENAAKLDDIDDDLPF